MELTKEKITNILLVSLVVIAASSIYLGMTETINKVCIVLEFGILLVLGFLHRIFSDIMYLVVLLLNIVSILVTALDHKGFGVYLVFLNVLMACMVFNNIQISRKTYLVLHLIAAVLLSGVALGISKSSSILVTTRWGDTEENFQFLGAVLHPNTWGQIAFAAALNWICVIDCLNLKKTVRMAGACCVAAVFGIVIVDTGCRAVLFAGVAFIILYLFKFSEIEYKYYYWIVVSVLVASLAFTYIYLEMYSYFSSAQILGKSGANRIAVWTAAYEQIKAYPLFGSGTELPMAKWDSAHNMLLHVIKTMGLMPVISLVFVLVKRRKTLKDICFSRTAQYSFLASLIIAFFESFLLESYIYLFFLFFLLNYGREPKCYGDKSTFYFKPIS